MSLSERQALALLRSGTTVTELVRQHGHDLEVQMDFGKGMIAAARLDIVEDPTTGETNVRATADVVDRGRKVKATLESSMADAEDWIKEAIENNSGKLALAAVADFVQSRGGSRKMIFARRFGASTQPSAGVGAKALAAKNEENEEIVMPSEHDDGNVHQTIEEYDEFRRDPLNPPDTPYHLRKWR